MLYPFVLLNPGMHKVTAHLMNYVALIIAFAMFISYCYIFCYLLNALCIIQPRMACGCLASGDLPMHGNSQGFQPELDRLGSWNNIGSQVHASRVDRRLYDWMVRK